ncbi:MAG: alpha/beta hydrolase [Planktomarina sp.]|nr:alpha/beta hydrolase [Planktomarina sp.]
MNFLKTESGRLIAYSKSEGKGPGVVFLGGFMSDMTGTKAHSLQAWCEEKKMPFLRFDYSGHGSSSGFFTDGCIGDWADDALATIVKLTKGPQILVGSSMGGWIALLLAQRIPDKIFGLVTVAAAPDFTEDGIWANFDNQTRKCLLEEGIVSVPSDYGSPYPITKRLIEDGRKHLVLRTPLRLPFPVRLLQGDQDKDVSVELANQLFQHIEGSDVCLTLLKGADHSFSRPNAIALLKTSILDIVRLTENAGC